MTPRSCQRLDASGSLRSLLITVPLLAVGCDSDIVRPQYLGANNDGAILEWVIQNTCPHVLQECRTINLQPTKRSTLAWDTITIWGVGQSGDQLGPVQLNTPGDPEELCRAIEGMLPRSEPPPTSQPQPIRVTLDFVYGFEMADRGPELLPEIGVEIRVNGEIKVPRSIMTIPRTLTIDVAQRDEIDLVLTNPVAGGVNVLAPARNMQAPAQGRDIEDTKWTIQVALDPADLCNAATLAFENFVQPESVLISSDNNAELTEACKQWSRLPSSYRDTPGCQAFRNSNVARYCERGLHRRSGR